MIIQIANIISGFFLAAPKLREFGAREQVDKFSAAIKGFAVPLGMIELGLGVLALVERMGVVHFYVYRFGPSYPQALPAIAAGLILSAHLFQGNSGVSDLIARLKENEVWIGMWALLAGLVSLLFGCVFCYY